MASLYVDKKHRRVMYQMKNHEMKILLGVTSAKIWPASGMLTVNITIQSVRLHLFSHINFLFQGLMRLQILKLFHLKKKKREKEKRKKKEEEKKRNVHSRFERKMT